MCVTLFHISDTHLGHQQYQLRKRADDFADVLQRATGYAGRNDIDVFLHTGDLFESASAPKWAEDDAIDAFSHLTDQNIPAYLVHGDHDHTGIRGGRTPSVDKVCARSEVERLGRSPTLVSDEVVLYGLHNEEIRWFGPEAATQLVPPPDDVTTVLCIHEMPTHFNYPNKPDDIQVDDLVRHAPFTPTLVLGGDLHKSKKWTTPLNRVPCRFPGAPARIRKNLLKDGYGPTAFRYTIGRDGLHEEDRIPAETRPHHYANIEVQPGENADDVVDRILSEIVKQDGGEPLSTPLSEWMVEILLSGDGSTINSNDVQDQLENRGVFYADVGVTSGFLLK